MNAKSLSLTKRIRQYLSNYFDSRPRWLSYVLLHYTMPFYPIMRMLLSLVLPFFDIVLRVLLSYLNNL